MLSEARTEMADETARLGLKFEFVREGEHHQRHGIMESATMHSSAVAHLLPSSTTIVDKIGVLMLLRWKATDGEANA